MADTYKILGQALTGLNSEEIAIYQVPNAKQTAVSAIEITNSDSSSTTYTLAFVPSEESAGLVLNKHIVIYDKTIAPGETHEIKGGVTLSEGDQIRVYSDSAEIITNVYGVEIV
jgi:hypothetical protein